MRVCACACVRMRMCARATRVGAGPGQIYSEGALIIENF